MSLPPPALETVIEELRKQNADLIEQLRLLSDSLRTDCARQHTETLEAVNATANERIPFNVKSYLDDFSKALSAEVRMLLKEVGKLREEKRTLQFELGALLTLQSHYGPAGEFEPNWRPPGGRGPGEPVRPAWRNVQPPPKSKRQREREAAAAAAAAAGVSEGLVPPADVHSSWASWRQQMPGLFGPRSAHSSWAG
ncbi:hypothetical protein BS47DRAFT_1374002 [Hydnum rufescens UP504]|uniref:Uncharacterized protein n=1 Tax=Hydnum rufescens UP504 TaxID=1448309 RepID=A0A9P6AJS5_9AGAM|nr:hypothetical protein BS47DRAFT_1374002 [Hydnum rufescens UP504]